MMLSSFVQLKDKNWWSVYIEDRKTKHLNLHLPLSNLHTNQLKAYVLHDFIINLYNIYFI